MFLIYLLDTVHKCPGVTKHFYIVRASIYRAGFLASNTQQYPESKYLLQINNDECPK